MAPIKKQIHLIAAVVLTVGAVSGLPAQTVRGTVVDSATSRPVSSASVELVRVDSQMVERVSTDESGAFTLRAPEPGRYRVRVARLGYRAYESALFLSRGEAHLAIGLAAVAVGLDPVGVSAEQLYPHLKASGFYERKQGGVGHFLDPAMVGKLAPKARLVADMLDHIPGISVGLPDGPGDVRVPHLRSCRTASIRLVPGFGPVSQTPATDRYTDTLSIYPRVFVDGMDTGIGAGRMQDTFGMLLPSEVLAVEVYMGAAQVPLQYGGTDSPCGVILIWLKR